MSSTTVRIFIGSGEQSLLERKVLIYSLHKHTKRDLDIRVFNGTHNTTEQAGHEPVPAPLSSELQRRNLTEFSLYRYLIPELCDFQGRAIYLDSDMICLADIGEMFDLPVGSADFLAKRAYADEHNEMMWALSALLLDCSRVRFDLAGIFDEIDRGLFTYTEFSQMGKKFLSLHPHSIGELDESWNVFDKRDSETKIIHYTNLRAQPWKHRRHPYGELWFAYLWEARQAGWVTDDDIDVSIRRGHVRGDLRCGNNPSVVCRLKSLLGHRHPENT